MGLRLYNRSDRGVEEPAQVKELRFSCFVDRELGDDTPIPDGTRGYSVVVRPHGDWQLGLHVTWTKGRDPAKAAQLSPRAQEGLAGAFGNGKCCGTTATSGRARSCEHGRERIFAAPRASVLLQRIVVGIYGVKDVEVPIAFHFAAGAGALRTFDRDVSVYLSLEDPAPFPRPRDRRLAFLDLLDWDDLAPELAEDSDEDMGVVWATREEAI